VAFFSRWVFLIFPVAFRDLLLRCDLLWSDPDDRCGWGISPRGVHAISVFFMFFFLQEVEKFEKSK